MSVTAIYLLGFVSSWPWYFIVVALCIAIALGLVFGEVWAKYLWYAIAASISVVWLGANAGLIWSLFLSLLTDIRMYRVVSLIPGLLLLAVCGCGIATTRAAYARQAAGRNR